MKKDFEGASLPEIEHKVLNFWKENKVFEKSLSKDSPKGEFVFYDGPPFATGLPHTGSLLSSIIKDVVPRYKTMRGYRVRRRWGWDCHGLPIESLVEKQLNLKTKKDILSVGIDTFNETARSMVLQYVDDWEKYVDRVGRWVDFKDSYKTMDNTYIESVWWALKNLYEKELLYEGRKVLMYCPHCETPLAKAEIAMDNTYQDVTEEAVTVKFRVTNPAAHGLPENTYILAWTTTPWTLPGNVALAVGENITYVVSEKAGENFITAKERLPEGVNIVSEIKGSTLVGVEYEPLFDVPLVAAHQGKKYVVLTADFVSTEEGTGIVHTAVMYGEDDFALGQREGLPMVQMLDASGNYNEQAPELVRGKYIKAAEKDIKKDLESRGLMFEKKNNTHSYPHCYRCGTPLIYNAVSSWFINIQKVKDRMLEENEKVNWVPDHLKHGRFQHIVDNAPDWTISRNRFWASPLPIWKEKGGKGVMLIGSLEEMNKKAKKSGNRYFFMRHGEADHNVSKTQSTVATASSHLTDKGKKEVESSIPFIKESNIDLAFISPFVRSRETVDIVSGVSGIPSDKIIVDERLSELNTGPFDGQETKEYEKQFPDALYSFDHAPDGGETFSQMRKRMGEFIEYLEESYQGKNILIISHGHPFWMLLGVARGLSKEEILGIRGTEYLKTGEVREVEWKKMPRNKDFELDLHRPYADGIVLLGEDGKEYERIPEVVDCWVESGAMPFAEYHYPFENKEEFEKRTPGDFIAEYIAQTRTWFYYMHAMGVALFDRLAFKNVVSTGTILAADGSKMSKSKGNYTDPLEMMEKLGADPLRFHLMNSVVMQAEDLAFKDEDVREAQNRVINMLRNCLKFYELYKADFNGTTKASDSRHPLDLWIMARINQTVEEITKDFDAFNLPIVCRNIRALIDDYSTWYVRRSRERVKGGAEVDKQFALAVQKEALLTIAKLIAPIMPFTAEAVYAGADGGLESVHLETWPEYAAYNQTAISDMASIRELASKALRLREKAGIKVRQPLASLTVKSSEPSLKGKNELLEMLKDEANVKQVLFNDSVSEEAELDLNLTPELKAEGMMRDLTRLAQDLRKKTGLKPQDTIELFIEAPQDFMDIITPQLLSFGKEVGAVKVEFSKEASSENESAGKIGNYDVKISLKKSS